MATYWLDGIPYEAATGADGLWAEGIPSDQSAFGAGGSAPAEPIVGLRKQPRVWVEIYLVPTPDTDPTQIYAWSTEPIAHPSTYYQGFKLGVIRAGGWGPIIRSASDSQGEYRAGEMTFQASDTENVVRALLDDIATHFFLNRHVVLRMGSDVGPALGLTPRTLWRGRMKQPVLQTGLGVDFPCEDLLGSQISPLDLDRQIPTRMINSTDFPDAPTEVLGLPVPIIYGEVSDQGSDSPKGMIPVLYVGPKLVTSSGAPAPPEVTTTTTKLDPPVLTASVVGAPGSRTLCYCATYVTATGETSISNIVEIKNAPNTLSTSNYVRLTMTPTAQADAHWNEILKVWPYVYEGTKSTATPSKFHWLDSLRYDTEIGWYDDHVRHYNDDGDDSHFKSRTAPTKNTATISVEVTTGGGGPTTIVTEWDTYLICGHAIGPIHGIFASDMDEVDPKRTLMDWSSVGASGDFLLPGYPGWPYGSNRYVDINGRRYGVLFARGPRSEAHKDGRVSIALNACGITENASGTGNVIGEAFRAYQHLLCNWILPNDGQGYQSGLYFGVPVFDAESGSIPMVQTTTFAACQTLSQARLANTTGYLAGFMIREFMPVRDLIRRCNLSFDAFLYPNRHGQIAVGMINDLADPAAGSLYRETIDLAAVGAPDIRGDEIENTLDYSYDYDPDTASYRSGVITMADALAVAAAKATIKAEAYEFFCVRDQATATDVAGRRLKRYKLPPIYVPISGDLSLLDVELFDQIRVTGREGLGATGFQARPVVVVEHAVDPNTGAVALVGFDLSRLLAATFGALQDETTMTQTLGDETILSGPGAALELT